MGADGDTVVYDLFAQSVPADLREVLAMEYELYQVTRLYQCTRSAAVAEMGWQDQLPRFDGWAVRLHQEFYHLEQRVRNKKH